MAAGDLRAQIVTSYNPQTWFEIDETCSVGDTIIGVTVHRTSTQAAAPNAEFDTSGSPINFTRLGYVETEINNSGARHGIFIWHLVLGSVPTNPVLDPGLDSANGMVGLFYAIEGTFPAEDFVLASASGGASSVSSLNPVLPGLSAGDPVMGALMLRERDQTPSWTVLGNQQASYSGNSGANGTTGSSGYVKSAGASVDSTVSWATANEATAVLFGFHAAGAADTTDPTLAITAPHGAGEFDDLQSAGVTAGNFDFAGTAADDVAVDTVEVRFDGGAWLPATFNAGTWDLTHDVSAMTVGEHTIEARSTDTSANVSAIASETFWHNPSRFYGSGASHAVPITIEGYTSVAVQLVSQPTPNAGSADFDGAIDAGWSTVPGTVDPTFDGFSVVDGRLHVQFDVNEDIDPGTANDAAGLGAPRIETAIADADFDIYTKLDSDPLLSTATFAGMGFIVRNGSTSARFDLYNRADASSGRQAQAYVKYASTTASASDPTSPTGSAGEVGYPTHLRLQRIGDQFTYSASFDGSTWTQMAQFTWAVVPTHLGVHFYQLASAPDGTLFELDYIHLGAQTPQVLAADPHTRTTEIAPAVAFDDLTTHFTDESVNGGTASVSTDTLTLSCTTTDRSSGRIVSVNDFGPDVGVTFRMRRIAQVGTSFFGVVLRGNPIGALEWAGQYTTPIGYVFEGNTTNDDVVRMLRVGGEAPLEIDGAKWTYLTNTDIPASDLSTGDWVRIRFEAIGPFIRCKVWDDGSAEPSTWDQQAYDGAVRAAGGVGFALSHNDGGTRSATLEFEELEVYSIT